LDIDEYLDDNNNYFYSNSNNNNNTNKANTNTNNKENSNFQWNNIIDILKLVIQNINELNEIM
jgi:predicted glycosyltransferase